MPKYSVLCYSYKLNPIYSIDIKFQYSIFNLEGFYTNLVSCIKTLKISHFIFNFQALHSQFNPCMKVLKISYSTFNIEGRHTNFIGHIKIGKNLIFDIQHLGSPCRQNGIYKSRQNLMSNIALFKFHKQIEKISQNGYFTRENLFPKSHF